MLRPDRRFVELATLGGHIAYGRHDWVRELAGLTEMEPMVAWASMALDLTDSVIASPATPPRPAERREQLLERCPQSGPIFA